MPPLTHLLLLLTALPLATTAFQLPFRLPWVSALVGDAQAPFAPTLPDPAAPPSNRIAVIGAGAGGSAAAFWLGKARERHGLDVQVDVFERSGYVGGRSTTVHPYNDPTLTPIELGASIFVRANKNLWRATDEFGLARTDFADSEDGDGDGTMGIWDGAEFRLMTGYSKVGGWWDTLKVLWRYGFRAPSRTKALVQTMLTQFLTLYAPGPGPYASIAALVARFNWTDAVNTTAAAYFAARGVDRRWTMEMVEAATRVNYGQNADAIHALEALCSLAADNASQVTGGNWQIFAEFLARSNATLHLNTTVTAVRQLPDGQFAVRTRARSPNSGDTETDADTETEQTYRAVLLAAPYHTSSIPIHLASASASGPAPDVPAVPDVPEQPYVRLHVTLLSTPAPHAKARYFRLKEGAEVPRMVLTTWEGVRAGAGAGADASEGEGEGADEGEGEGAGLGDGEGDGEGAGEREGQTQTQSARAPEFNSLSYHGKLTRLDGTPANITRRGSGGEGEGREEWAVKIFSDKKIEDRWLRRVFGEVGWVHRKEWDAYPVLPPTTSFPPIELAKGLYYVNAFEPLISTMETETLSARNAVELLLRDEFGAGLCASGPGDDVPEGYVYGWDCL